MVSDADFERICIILGSYSGKEAGEMNHQKPRKKRLEDASEEFLSYLPEKLSEIAKEAGQLEEELEYANPVRRREIDARISEIKEEVYHLIADAAKDPRMMN